LKKILTIVGPTAIGKTELSVSIAKNINGQIIGLDSRQIYKKMPIGTAQPNKDEMMSIKHHLVGIKDPNETVSAGKYSDMVLSKVNDVIDDGFTPIIVGGAGLYYRAITRGIFDKSSSDNLIRSNLEKQYDENPEYLYDKLKKIDPVYSKIVHINNKKRLVRALEIYQISGTTPTEHFDNQKMNQSKKLDLFTVFLVLKRDAHRKIIKSRALKMLEKGWIKEVENLISLKNKKNSSFPALNSIGYKQISNYLEGQIDKNELLDIIVNKTWQYARKQNQWFKKESINLTVDTTNLNLKELGLHISDIYKSSSID
jgi:tRNA dimethylallyltransferase